MATLNISISDALQSRLNELADQRGEGADAVVIDALERLFEDESDRTEIAARMARFKETGKAFEHDEVIETLRRRASGLPGE
ncbi:MAG: hypothetical protein ACK46Q_02025 [Hyphomonas sp.]